MRSVQLFQKWIHADISKDWYHESCLNLRDRDKTASRAPSIAPDTTGQDPTDDLDEDEDEDPSLLPGDTYDALICGPCALSIPTVRRWAGTTGIFAVVRDSSDDEYHVVGESPPDDEVDLDMESSLEVGGKRPLPTLDHADEHPSKRARASSSSSSAITAACLAPPVNATMQNVYDALERKDPVDTLLGAGDVFLTEGWRERWCKCDNVRFLTRTYFMKSLAEH